MVVLMCTISTFNLHAFATVPHSMVFYECSIHRVLRLARVWQTEWIGFMFNIERNLNGTLFCANEREQGHTIEKGKSAGDWPQCGTANNDLCELKSKNMSERATLRPHTRSLLTKLTMWKCDDVGKISCAAPAFHIWCLCVRQIGGRCTYSRWTRTVQPLFPLKKKTKCNCQDLGHSICHCTHTHFPEPLLHSFHMEIYRTTFRAAKMES